MKFSSFSKCRLLHTIAVYSEWGLCPGGLGTQFLVLRTVQKPQSHRHSQKPPPSISSYASLKWFSSLTHAHAWLLSGPLLVSVLLSPAPARLSYRWAFIISYWLPWHCGFLIVALPLLLSVVDVSFTSLTTAPKSPRYHKKALWVIICISFWKVVEHNMHVQFECGVLIIVLWKAS